MGDSDVVEMRDCRDCGTQFPFTERDKEFYEKQGWTTRPNRCKPCRIKRKNEKGNIQ